MANPISADYIIVGLYLGITAASQFGVTVQLAPLDPALLTAEMFVAFSKKSPCAGLAEKFGQGITELTTDGSFDKMLTEATAKWDSGPGKP